MSITQIDLRGFSCPIPLIKTQTALQQYDEVIVLVDDVPPKENIIRFARAQNYTVDCTQENGQYTIHIIRN